MKLLIGLVAVTFIFYISFLNWRRAVKAVFFLLIIEGALRKWVIPQASDMIYFLKDFVLLGAYTRYYLFSFSEIKFPIRNNSINVLILLASGWCFFQAINPSLGSPIIGIFGIKAYLLYIPLIWLMPSMFQSEEELYKFLRSHLLLVIPVGILGIVQFFSPISSPINTYAPGAVSEVASFGYAGSTNARITGTFSYINSYTGYLISCFGLLIPFLSIKQSRWWMWASIIEIFLLAVNAFMTGSRTPIFNAALVFLGYLGAKGLRQPSKTLVWIGRLLPIATVAAIAAFIGFRPAIDAFSQRVNSNQDLSGRYLSAFTEPFAFIKYKELDGYGTGATHQGSVALRTALGLPAGESIPTYYESEMGRVALEIGPIGFLLWYGLRISIAMALWLVFWKLKRPFLRDLALTACLVQVVLIAGQMVFHNTFALYYWFFSGFVFLLPRLEQIENFRREREVVENV